MPRWQRPRLAGAGGARCRRGRRSLPARLAPGGVDDGIFRLSLDGRSWPLDPRRLVVAGRTAPVAVSGCPRALAVDRGPSCRVRRRARRAREGVGGAVPDGALRPPQPAPARRARHGLAAQLRGGGRPPAAAGRRIARYHAGVRGVWRDSRGHLLPHGTDLGLQRRHDRGAGREPAHAVRRRADPPAEAVRDRHRNLRGADHPRLRRLSGNRPRDHAAGRLPVVVSRHPPLPAGAAARAHRDRAHLAGQPPADHGADPRRHLDLARRRRRWLPFDGGLDRVRDGGARDHLHVVADTVLHAAGSGLPGQAGPRAASTSSIPCG